MVLFSSVVNASCSPTSAAGNALDFANATVANGALWFDSLTCANESSHVQMGPIVIHSLDGSVYNISFQYNSTLDTVNINKPLLANATECFEFNDVIKSANNSLAVILTCLNTTTTCHFNYSIPYACV